MSIEYINCPVCGSRCEYYPDFNLDKEFYECPICGRYELTSRANNIQDNNCLASYLFYNRFIDNQGKTEYRYHTTLDKEKCDEYKAEFKKGDITNGFPVHMDIELIESWYPKSFSDRIDKILLKANSCAPHIGQTVCLDNSAMFSLLFVDRKEMKTNNTTDWRELGDCIKEADYMLDCLKETGYFVDYLHLRDETGIKLTITPKGYARIEELQKNISNGRNALVAMKFGEDTLILRESIRKGIMNAGYNAVFIDEVEHINFITPELLKHIRDSKFVVVDLTHQNNGAYFEEGYAMGLNKPVIQLCRDGVKLHFDIAQKNTIMWKTEDDIPTRLENRIRAIID